MYETHYGKDHYEIAVPLNNLGRVYLYLGDFEQSRKLLERALTIQEKYYSKDTYRVSNTLINFGIAYGDLGDIQKKKKPLERVLATEENYYGKKNYEVTLTLYDLGKAYGKLGDLQKKKELLERALIIEENHYGKEHYKVASRLLNLAKVYGKLCDLQKKKELLECALNIQEKHYGKEHYEMVIMLVNLGIAYGYLGDIEKKKELLERALNIQEAHYSKEHYQVAITLYNLGNVYGALGDIQKNKESFERALPIFKKHYEDNDECIQFILRKLLEIEEETQFEMAIKESLIPLERNQANFSDSFFQIAQNKNPEEDLELKAALELSLNQNEFQVIENADLEEDEEFKKAIEFSMVDIGAATNSEGYISLKNEKSDENIISNTYQCHGLLGRNSNQLTVVQTEKNQLILKLHKEIFKSCDDEKIKIDVDKNNGFSIKYYGDKFDEDSIIVFIEFFSPYENKYKTCELKSFVFKITDYDEIVDFINNVLKGNAELLYAEEKRLEENNKNHLSR